MHIMCGAAHAAPFTHTNLSQVPERFLNSSKPGRFSEDNGPEDSLICEALMSSTLPLASQPLILFAANRFANELFSLLGCNIFAVNLFLGSK
jgi:hypothetical protein